MVLWFHAVSIRYLPALEAEEVAREAIQSILTDEAVCIVPRYMSFLVALRK